MVAKKKIGDILIESGLVSKKEVDQALLQQKNSKKKLGEILVSLNALSEDQLANVLSQMSSVPFVNLDQVKLDSQVANYVDVSFCKKNCLVPIALRMHMDKEQLVIAFNDPMNLEVMDQLRFMVDKQIFRVLSTHSAIIKTIEKQYNVHIGQSTIDVSSAQDEEPVINRITSFYDKERNEKTQVAQYQEEGLGASNPSGQGPIVSQEKKTIAKLKVIIRVLEQKKIISASEMDLLIKLMDK